MNWYSVLLTVRSSISAQCVVRQVHQPARQWRSVSVLLCVQCSLTKMRATAIGSDGGGNTFCASVHRAVAVRISGALHRCLRMRPTFAAKPEAALSLSPPLKIAAERQTFAARVLGQPSVQTGRVVLMQQIVSGLDCRGREPFIPTTIFV